MKCKKGILKKATALLLVGMMALPVNSVYAANTNSDTRSIEGNSTFTTTQNARQINFDEDWRFHWAGDKNHTGLDVTGAQNVDFDDSSWRKVDLPHDWSIEFDFNIKNSIVGSEAGYLDGGTGWYRKTFTLPTEMNDKRIQIRFGGVYMNSTVYVNGQSVGTYPNGYTPFTYDITDYVKADGKSENVIAVKATNDQPTSRWYSGSGIYRSVNLLVTDDVHIANEGVFVTTPNIKKEYDSGNVGVNVKTEVSNKDELEKTVQVRTSILNYTDNSEFVAPIVSDEVTIGVGETKEVQQNLNAKNPKLWGINDSHLYNIRSEIVINGEVVDTVDTRFGFRWFDFDANDGFSLNGEWMKLKGVCMHHDQGALGAEANYRAIERQMDSMIEMGANAIRVTHNPASDELLEICDKKGLMVVEEAFDTWYSAKKSNDMHKYFDQPSISVPNGSSSMTWAEYDFKAMIRRGRNYPSIIMWSAGNEVAEANGDDKSVQTMKNLKKWGDEVDGTRPITQGADKYRFGNGTGGHEKIGEIQDTVGFNYAEANYDAMHKKHPDWIIYGSETSSATKTRGNYDHPDTEGSQDSGAHPDYQQSSYDNDHVGWGRTASDSWIQDRDRKFIAGQFIWTGFDYIGEPTPWHNTGGAGHDKSPKSSYFGIVDTAGFAKDDYYLYQSQWTTKPMVHILPHWNFEDEALRKKVTDANGKIPVRIYSNAKTIELFVNGVSQGEKTFATKTTNYGVEYQQQSQNSTKLYQEWRLDYSYAPGTTIKAVAKDADGKEVATDIVTTADTSHKIALNADHQVINADGKDLSYITVDIQDKDGHFMPTAANEVNFKVVGDGEIVGVDNGDPTSHERYKVQSDGTWKRKAFNGKALVIVKSTKQSGSFTLTATSAGLAKDSVTIFTKEANVKDKDIIGYDVLNVVTNIHVEPQLPATVNAILANGNKQEKAVTWEKITEDMLSAAGTQVIKGTINDTKDTVTLKLTIVDFVSIKDISIVTGIGEIPQLPTQVTKVYSNGTYEYAPVVWERTLTADDVKTESEFILKGTVEKTKDQAICHIRVAKGTVVFDRNISTRVGEWPKTSASYEGGDKSDNVVDGKTGMDIRWTNWVPGNNAHAKNDWVALEFENEHFIGKVGMWWFKDANCRMPVKAILEYSQDGKIWAPVSNQSRVNGFEDNGGVEEEITFTPITTKYLRINVEANAKGNDSYYPLGITEFKVYEGKTTVVAHNDATLTDLKVDGKTINGFDANTHNYAITLPYGSAVPTITASTQNHATLTIIQAEDADSSAMIEVTAEDGTTKRIYSVQLNQLPAQLEKSQLSVNQTEITENQIIPLNLVNTKQDGNVIQNKQANIEYIVTEENGGHIEIVNHELYAYNAGKVKIKAKVTYDYVTVESNEIEITIQPSEEIKVLTRYDSVKIVSGLNVKPVLPNTVKAYYKNALARDVKVTWDEIDSKLYQKYGTFTVKGHVEGETLQPVATITINDVIAVQSYSTATRVGVPVSSLPEKLVVYYSDQTSQLEIVKWDLKGADFSKEGIIEIQGYVGEESNGRDNPARHVKAFVRVTNNNDELQQSANYAKQWTGSLLPAAFASNTNDGNDSSDRIEKINDTIVSFNDSPANRWTNWTRSPSGTQETVGIIFAEGGNLTQRYIDTVKTAFFKDSGTDAPADFKLQYYVPQNAPALPENYGHVTSGDLANNDNWKDVSNMTPDSTSAQAGSLQEFHFDQVQTYAIRLVMNRKSSMNGIAISEIEAYGKTAKLNDSFDVEEILVDGKNIIDQLQGFDYYQNATDKTPDIKVKVSQNASVTIVNIPGASGEAKVIVTAENQDIATTKTYTLHFETLDKDIQSVATLENKEVAFQTLFDNLNLPNKVEVTLNDGSKENVTVNWIQGDYQADKSGEYTLNGTLVLPDTITNTRNLMAQIKVTVLPETLYSISGNIDVGDTGVALKNIPVKLYQGDILKATVNTNEHGEYQFDNVSKGKYTLQIDGVEGNYIKVEKSIDVINENILVNTITLIKEPVEDIYISEITNIKDIQVNINTPFDKLLLPKTVIVTYSDKSTKEVSIKWSSDNYQTTAGEYTLIGELSVADKENPSQLKATIHIRVVKLTYKISGHIDTKNVEISQEGIIVKLYAKDDKDFITPLASTTTNKDGYYEFNNIHEGSYIIKVNAKKDTYKEVIKSVDVNDDLTDMNIVLETVKEDITEALNKVKTKLSEAKAMVKDEQYTETSRSVLQETIKEVEALLNTIQPALNVEKLNTAYVQLDKAINALEIQKDNEVPVGYWEQIIKMIAGAKENQKIKANLPLDGYIPSDVLKALAKNKVILIFNESEYVIDGNQLDVNKLTENQYSISKINELYKSEDISHQQTSSDKNTQTADNTNASIYFMMFVIIGIIFIFIKKEKHIQNHK